MMRKLDFGQETIDRSEPMVQFNFKISAKEKKRIKELAKMYATTPPVFLRHLINYFYQERMARE